MEYAVEITTVPGVADSDYLDRLADIVYAIPGLIDPLLGLNDDGSISASFCLAAATSDPLAATSDAVYAFAKAVAQAEPFRRVGPTEPGATLGHVGVSRVSRRDAALA